MVKKKQNEIEKFEEEVIDTVKKEWKILNRFRKQNEDRLLFAAFVIILSSMVVINTVYVLNRLQPKPNRVSTNTVMNPETVINSSQKASNSFFEVNITNVKEDATQDRAFAFREDETILSFTVTITNNSSSDQELFPVNQFYLRSTHGDFYTLHPSSALKNQLTHQTVKKGQTINGDAAFAIPKSLTNPLLYVDLGWQKATPIVYSVLQ